MSRAALLTTLVAGTALAGAGYYWTRRQRPAALPAPSGVVPIIAPVIDLGVAEAVLAQLERLPGDEVTVVLHTAGGCVTSCVLIANALQSFRRSIAVVPYLAISGGTLIALSAKELQMGRSAALSAVDPIIEGERVRHLPDDMPTPGIHALALEYEEAIRRFLRQTISLRIPEIGPAHLDRAVSFFMGEEAPHAWPIQRVEVQAMGLPVKPASRAWAELVDAYRRRWW